MKAELKQTTNYDLFESNKYQQPMSERHVLALMDSMRQYGFIPSKPVGVFRRGSKLVLIDGHHRKEAARRVGVPVFFVVVDPELNDSIGDENWLVKKWKTESFVKMRADEGNAHYIELLKYCDRGIPLQQASSMLIGHAANSANAVRLLRNGDFVIKTRSVIDQVMHVIDECRSASTDVTMSTFIDALSALFFVPEFDSAVFIKRLKANPRMMVKCSNRDQMLDLIEEIYNFRTHEKVPLKHLAKASLDARRVQGNPR